MRHTEETKKKISQSMKGRPASSGAFKKGHKAYWFRTGGGGFKGKHHAEESKRKIGKSSKGRKPQDYKNWHPSMGMLGKHQSEETKKKISEYAKNNGVHPPQAKGKEHYNWKGGVTPEIKKIRNSIEFQLWRSSVFARDNWTCYKCEEKGGRLHSHHIRNFARWKLLRFAIDNGITLCKKCHIEFHKKYGKKDNDEIQLKEFIWKNKR